jgi:hypothetical protein
LLGVDQLVKPGWNEDRGAGDKPLAVRRGPEHRPRVVGWEFSDGEVAGLLREPLDHGRRRGKRLPRNRCGRVLGHDAGQHDDPDGTVGGRRLDPGQGKGAEQRQGQDEDEHPSTGRPEGLPPRDEVVHPPGQRDARRPAGNPKRGRQGEKVREHRQGQQHHPPLTGG